MNFENAQKYLDKWISILRLQDWDIVLRYVDVEWRKTGDIKTDMDDRNAILLLNRVNPKQTNLEELIIHELLHLKLWEMDQMIETLINTVYGEDETDKKRDFAYTQFMQTLEPTVNDLAKSFTLLGADDKALSFGRLEQQVRDEIGE